MRYLILLLFLAGCASTPSKESYVPKLRPATCYLTSGVVYGILNIDKRKGEVVYNVFIVKNHVKMFYFAKAEKFDKFNLSTSKQVKCE